MLSYLIDWYCFCKALIFDSDYQTDRTLIIRLRGLWWSCDMLFGIIMGIVILWDIEILRYWDNVIWWYCDMVFGITVGIEILWPQGLASASVSLFLVRGILNFFAPIWFPVDGRESLGKVRGGEKGLWRPPRPTIHPSSNSPPFPGPTHPEYRNQ